MNDSTTPGFLTPLTPTPLDDIALDAAIQPSIVGITGLPDACVVVKGQPIPPTQPGRTVTWCAFGRTVVDAPPNIDVVHDGEAAGGLGQSRYFRQEEIEVTASFYGPNARAMAASLRDGLEVGQNRDALRVLGLVYVRPERITALADLENTQFIRRADFVFRLRRMVGRTYAIRNILQLVGTLTADGGSATNAAPVNTDLGAALAATDPTIG